MSCFSFLKKWFRKSQSLGEDGVTERTSLIKNEVDEVDSGRSTMEPPVSQNTVCNLQIFDYHDVRISIQACTKADIESEESLLKFAETLGYRKSDWTISVQFKPCKSGKIGKMPVINLKRVEKSKPLQTAEAIHPSLLGGR